MTTPTFSAASTGFTTIRYFTASDPYYYTVDNRPLTDLSANASTLGSAADAGRRAAMMAELFDAVRNHSAFGATRYVEGLRISTTTTQATVEAGTVFEPLAVSGSDATVIMKQAASPASQVFAINSVSLTGSQSVVYAIEAKYTDFDNTVTGYSLYDNTNTIMPSSMLFGKLSLQVVAGSAATTGSQTAPSVTAGWFQLYLITVTGPSGTPTIANVTYPTSPTFNSWGLPTQIYALQNLPASGTTTVTVGDISTVTNFADAATSGAILQVPLLTNEVRTKFNAWKPVKVRIAYSPSISSNNFVARLRYAYMSATTSVTGPSYTTLSNETFSAGTADQLSLYTFTNTIPGYAGLSADHLRIIIDRIGADGSDTNTGALRVTQVQVFQ
jgi:hypothetical protein